MDSTTISLFKEILKGCGRNPENGKKKGGIKAHTMIKIESQVPCLVRFTQAATHDHVLLSEIHLAEGSIYKKRWQIELIFKQLKQNFQLKYFLGDNQNAIEIQIWCAMLANLLLMLVKSRVSRRWAFSNFVSVIREQLMNYINIYNFLENPEQSWRKIIAERAKKETLSPSLFPNIRGA